VNKLVSIMVIGLMGLIALIAAGPILVGLAHSLVPLVLVVGIVSAVLRAVWFFTR
jgi:hypothetical protein